MYRFGSHVSCAGGLLQAVQRAKELQCQCVQIFVSSPRAWPNAGSLIPNVVKRKPGATSLDQRSPSQEADEFHTALSAAKIQAPIAHACYLINLASPDAALREKSIDALVVEWQRAEDLRLSGIVMHPGSHTTGTADDGMANIVRGIQAALDRVAPMHCPLLLENTAGQGSCLGWQIEQLGWLLNRLPSDMIGVCWDTCHALAAGYDFRTISGLHQMVEQLQASGVLSKIRAVHANDSVKECGSRVDRHEHIGLGCIGANGWPVFLKSPEFKDLPMYLETEKGVDEEGVDWDRRNLDALRRFSA